MWAFVLLSGLWGQLSHDSQVTEDMVVDSNTVQHLTIALGGISVYIH